MTNILKQSETTSNDWVKNIFIPILKKRLPLFFRLVDKESLSGELDGKSKLLIKRFVKSHYRFFNEVPTLRDKLLSLKEKESNLDNNVAETNSFYLLDCAKCLVTDKAFKKRRAIFNRLLRSLQTKIKNLGETDFNFSKFLKLFPYLNFLSFSEYPKNFRHFLWEKHFLETTTAKVEKAFNQ